MHITYLIFWTMSFGFTWIGCKMTEEIHRLAICLAGSILLIWGFAIAPESMHWLVEILSISLCGFLSIMEKQIPS
ncbi:MAG: hypothetical protein CLLPBCKN_008048 [Chroococcidiopsis cubana SAG 39.79]|uniref:hypothetical protein n=2 Tax=Chroococcidiopsidaceae TaxID=1890528 RepID=UPI000F8D8EEF|nr:MULTISPECIES: hypothetical protein [Chroococcidiopsis]MDZ4878611.1 hypothetical protein [Chroococcidiopsis cubana SAG 39.79]URD48989.1 hypothetical protein M5J74_22000 [Chroococcidiopsis sp. CCNUC1]